MGCSGSKATSMTIKNVTLWKTDRSPPCRAVMMALDAMNLSVKEVDVNLDRGEHRTPDMIMRNPRQTLPIFQDNNLIIYESHAICNYLASRHSNSSRLLPTDPEARALLEQQMNYNGEVLYPRYRCATDPILYENYSFVMPQQVCNIECAYSDLESMLEGRPWFGGSWLSLADICLVATTSTLHCLVPIDRLRYPHLAGWLFRMSEQVFYITANKKGLCEFVQRIGELLNTNPKMLIYFTRNCTLWKTDRSPACRAVMMALDAMNLSVNEVDVNMDRGEHRAPELIMRNPRQTLPVFQDNALVIRDSHAICNYLASRYSNSGRLLPKDPGGRAVLEQQMCFNGGVLYPRYRAAIDPILYDNCNFVMPQQVCNIECAYADLECMLNGKQWFGGSWLTLADICLVATTSTLNCLVPVDRMRFPCLSCWLFRMSEEAFYITANKKGLCDFVRRIGELPQTQKC